MYRQAPEAVDSAWNQLVMWLLACRASIRYCRSFAGRRVEWGCRSQHDQGLPGVNGPVGGEVADRSVERPRQTAAVSRVAELLAESQGGLLELVDAEFDLGEVAVTGLPVGFGHEARGDAASLMGLGGDGILDQGVAAGCKGGDAGHFKAFEGLCPNEAHDIAIDLSREERLAWVGHVGVIQLP